MSAVAAALFALLAVGVLRTSGRPLPGDAGLHRWCLEHRPPVAVAVARLVTDTGTGAVPYALVLLAGVLVGRSEHRRATTALVLALCLAGGQAVRWSLMSLIARPRPDAADWAVHAGRWAFPSGHSTTAALTAGLLVAALFLRAAGPGRRPVSRGAVALIGVWGVAVGMSRVYLGVHWPSDMLGGWLLATAWLSLLTCAYLRRGRVAPPCDA
ncbi:phosphatase PAP2 family protein [Streptomyces sp. NPDC091268]|uniref:phosphatase PAP2 family protein n=1 Tax=Streptomyces sp. NPDC091268 TaxID=3365979 RepID=UPI003824CCEF